MRPWRGVEFGGLRTALVALPLLLAGCASTAIQDNQAATSAFALHEVGVEVQLQSTDDARAAAATNARTLLAEPLTADGAVQIAVGYSPTFQRLLADSAAASAAATQSARLPNPILSYSCLAAGDVTEIERALTLSLLDFVLLPQRRRLADLQQAQHRLRSAGDVIGTATAAREAWIDAVAARQSLAYAAQAQKAAEAGAELGRRMAAVGNFSRLEAAREQAFYAETTAEVARAQLEAQRTREVLIRLLGLSGDLADKLTLPDRLPDLPANPDDESVLARRAFDERLDVALARAELDFTARSLGLTRVTSTVNALEVGVASDSATGEETLNGYELELRLPLFDFGDARRANAEAVYLAALNRTAAVIAEAQSHLRESYLAYRTTYDLARHYRDEIVPLRKTISEENLLRYNGMLISVFELLADAREQVASVRQAITAQRDFWAADASLRSTLIGRPVEGVALGLPNVTPGAGTAQPH
ncbi:MAG: TolC family protein [Proteobacteria bacterium]|nr:TolC family protein [Pseudomonadota bacterium]